jgi:hypothetical protein
MGHAWFFMNHTLNIFIIGGRIGIISVRFCFPDLGEKPVIPAIGNYGSECRAGADEISIISENSWYNWKLQE